MIVLINAGKGEEAMKTIEKDGFLSCIPKRNIIPVDGNEINGQLIFVLGYKNAVECVEEPKKKNPQQLTLPLDKVPIKDLSKKTAPSRLKKFFAAKQASGISIIDAKITDKAAPRGVMSALPKDKGLVTEKLKVINKDNFEVLSKLIDDKVINKQHLVPVFLKTSTDKLLEDGSTKVIDKESDGFLYGFKDINGKDWTLCEFSLHGVKLLPAPVSYLTKPDFKITGFSREFFSFEFRGKSYKRPSYSFRRVKDNSWAIEVVKELLMVLQGNQEPPEGYSFNRIAFADRGDGRHAKAIVFENQKGEVIVDVRKSIRNHPRKRAKSLKDLYSTSDLF